MIRVVHRPGRHEVPAGAGRRDRVVTVQIADPDATVGDLAAALGRQPTVPLAGLVVDGTWHPPSAAATDLALHVGSVLEPALTPPSPAPTPARVLAVVGGLRAGGASAFGERVVVGRGGACSFVLGDPTLGRRHFTIDGDHIEAENSANPMLLDGVAVDHGMLDRQSVVTAGATQLAPRDATDDRPLAVREGLGRSGGLLPFNRPPRISPAVQAPTLTCPAEPPPPDAVEPPSIATLVLPVVAGAAMAVLFSPYMAIFTALGPLLTLGTWWERRRRSRRTHRRAVREVAQAIADVAATLDTRREAERTRRRALIPDPAEVVRRAKTGSVRLWERRAEDDDAFVVGIGTATMPYVPELVTSGGPPARDMVALIDGAAPLADVPIPLELAPGTTIGIVGPAKARQAVGRALAIQLATHHGPSDLAISVVAEPDHLPAWQWTTWLPHTVDRVTGDLPLTSLGVDAAEHLEARLRGADTAHLTVLDGNTSFEGRSAPGRRAVAADHAIVVALVDDTHRLPAGCEHIAVVDELGRLELLDPRVAGSGTRGLAWGLAAEEAEAAARGLARFDDPELVCVGAGIPDRADLLGLLGIDPRPADIEQRWSRTRGTAALMAPIGRDADGPVDLDLVADGPHLLVGGTTGAGKSELLRSLVASFAATADPDHVAFVLVDYKGGAAFDCCADLPHVAGLVTDLDADLAARALRCLDAELHRRELLLRSVGAEDLAAYRTVTAARPDAEPLPRLVLVVDEFASLAADLPEFLDALVGIAQRGRSLGVHMILATQRPAGVVTDDIRANTGCRIALRVTGRHESSDIIDAPDAASIPRSRPGRAVARFGPGELVGFQSALVTGRSSSRARVQISSLFDGPEPGDDAGPSDLERLVAAIRTAHGDRPVPKAPWPEPLPAAGTATAEGWWLVDQPSEQRQSIETWTPADGHLVVLGGPGSGVSTTLASAACAAIDAGAHIHGLDLDAGQLSRLDGLASVGTIAAPVDGERRLRILRWLSGEVERRRAQPVADHQPIVLVIDDLGGLTRAHDPVRVTAPHDQLASIWADGPAVGVAVVVGLRRAAELPPALAAGAGCMLAHRVLDPSDAHRFGIREVPLSMPPGRAVRASDGLQLQVLRPDGDLAAAIEARGDVVPATPPMRIGTLAAEIDLGEVAAEEPAALDGGVLRIPVGRLDADLAVAMLELHPGDHALVLGPSRSGRTTVLAAIARSARPLGIETLVVGAAGSELASRLGVEAVSAVDLPDLRGPTLVLVDDAMDLDDPAGRLPGLIADGRAWLVASTRPDRLRNAYGHWTHELRASRAGMLLQPEPLDGDLLGASLPGRLDLAPLPGRGLLVVGGRHHGAQFAR